MTCKNFNTLWDLSFHSLKNVFQSVELFNFDEVQYISLWFMDSGFGVILRNLCLTQGHKGFFLSSEIFMVFKFYISVHDPFWVNFWIWCEVSIKIAFLHMTSVVPTHFVENTIFTKLPLHLCWKTVAQIYVGIFLDSILFHFSICLFHTKTTWPWLT